MTRWRRFGWALGYTGLTACGVLMVLGRVLLIVSKALECDSYALTPVILGLLVSMAVLAVTIHLFRKPEPGREAVPYANA